MKTPEQMAEEYAKEHHMGGWEYEASIPAWLAGYKACRNHIHLHWKEEWKDLYKRIEESCLPAMDAMEGRYLHKITELEAAIPCWISVKDRLPEIDKYGYSEDVLLLSQVGRMEVSHIEKVKRVVKWRGIEPVIETGNGTPIEYFTHWQPLPAAPKEEK